MKTRPQAIAIPLIGVVPSKVPVIRPPTPIATAWRGRG
jgi:hypothetical protein